MFSKNIMEVNQLPKVLYHYTSMSVLCSLLNNLKEDNNEDNNLNYSLKF